MGNAPQVFPAPPRLENEPLVAAAADVVRTLHQKGHEAYFAGGYARDQLIGRPAHDIDIATGACPDDVLALFPGSHGFGKSFGVVQVERDGFVFEIATFRQDVDYRDGRRPESVIFTTAADDAQRRDFTINGMFYDPETNTIIDYVQGAADVGNKIIRAIGDPAQRFREDHLRLMRAIRFASVLEFTIDENTWAAIRAAAPSLAAISMERIRDELIRTFMEAPKPGAALYRLRDSGILSGIFPEAEAMNGVEQPPEFHPEGDVFVHTALMLDQMQERSPALIWSILLHDIAKPVTYAVGADKQGKPRIQFYGHAERGATMSESILKRFRCSNDLIESVATAVRNHMRFSAVPQMRNATLRRWIGSPTFPLELELHRVDCLASHGGLDHYHQVQAFRRAMEAEPVLPPALIGGKDLLALGMKGGPRMGKALKRIYDAQLEGAFSDHEAALAWVKENILR
jgi:poly(A) polymerase